MGDDLDENFSWQSDTPYDDDDEYTVRYIRHHQSIRLFFVRPTPYVCVGATYGVCQAFPTQAGKLILPCFFSGTLRKFSLHPYPGYTTRRLSILYILYYYL